MFSHTDQPCAAAVRKVMLRRPLLKPGGLLRPAFASFGTIGSGRFYTREGGCGLQLNIANADRIPPEVHTVGCQPCRQKGLDADRIWSKFEVRSYPPGWGCRQKPRCSSAAAGFFLEVAHLVSFGSIACQRKLVLPLRMPILPMRILQAHQ